MGFLLSEEQQALRATARKFVQAELPIAHLRALRDSNDPVGFSRPIWKKMAALGLVGVAIPSEWGGQGLGYAECGLLVEECGHTLAPVPWLSTVALGANALLAGTESQRREVVPAIAAGEKIVALAFSGSVKANRRDGKFVLSGAMEFVFDGHAADLVIVIADVEEVGPTLFCVEPNTAGFARRRVALVDSRPVAHLQFEAVSVSAAAMLGEPGGGPRILETVLDCSRALLSAEMLGSIDEVFIRTVTYLKDRKQFGVPIGSFQALKHRAAQLFCEIELCRSIVLDALRALDDKRENAALLVSAAKARASDVFVQMVNEAVQMHGGIGVTDELDIGLFLKRAKVAATMLGSASFHRDRFARLSGY